MVQELLRNCLGIVFVLKTHLLYVFLARKVDKSPLNLYLRAPFLGYFRVKKQFSVILKSGTGVVQEVFTHYYWPLNSDFRLIFSSKG